MKNFIESPSNKYSSVSSYVKLLSLAILRGFKYFFLNHLVLHVPSNTIRSIIYKNLYKINIHKRAAVHLNVKFLGHGANITIGEWSVINSECLLDGRCTCNIGKNVSVSRKTTILTMGHEYDDALFSLKGAAVNIDDDVWIGYDALILPGVTVGKGAVVAARAVVTKSVSPYSIVAGNPAKVIGHRKEQEYANVYYRPYFGGLS